MNELSKAGEEDEGEIPTESHCPFVFLDGHSFPHIF